MCGYRETPRWSLSLALLKNYQNWTIQGVVLFSHVKVQNQVSVCTVSWWCQTILFSRSRTPRNGCSLASLEWFLEISIKTSSCHILPIVSLILGKETTLLWFFFLNPVWIIYFNKNFCQVQVWHPCVCICGFSFLVKILYMDMFTNFYFHFV